MRFPLAASAFGCALVASTVLAEKIPVLKKDDLPRHTYEIEGMAVDFLEDRERTLALGLRIEADMLDDLEKYDIRDKPTLVDYYGRLAIVRFLHEEYDAYLAYREKSVDLLDKDSQKLTSGIFVRAWINARRSGNEPFPDALRSELETIVNALPFEIVGDAIKSRKGQAELINETLVRGGMESVMQPVLDQNDNEVTTDLAASLVRNHYVVNYFLPHKETFASVLDAYIDANEVEKEDIWAARDVTLEPGEGRDVVLAVWDSGLDTGCIPSNLWTNEDEIPGNGTDDDGNGFVDDRHGIAYDLDASKTTDLLFPIGEVEDAALLQRLAKGLKDVQANIDSEEASALKKRMAELKQDEVRPFLEQLSAYGAYMHGTHVSGITVAGNPHAKVLTSRLTFDMRMIPDKPTVEKARRDSAMYVETIDYYRKNGVRVVNMSWGGSVGAIESILEMHAEGESPEERKAKAREIFEIMKSGLENAIADAPEILFVTSAGNSDLDNAFVESIPAAIDLPNMISVGAVDQAGEETGFTSFGKVDIYANGFEVESYVPGGDRMPASGTSMSSPNVANLAGKILALRPELGPTEVRDLILETAEETMAGDRKVLLMHPAAAIERVRSVN